MTLWMSWRERELREIIVLPIIVLIMLVPVGAFSGATVQLLYYLVSFGKLCLSQHVVPDPVHRQQAGHNIRSWYLRQCFEIACL